MAGTKDKNDKTESNYGIPSCLIVSQSDDIKGRGKVFHNICYDNNVSETVVNIAAPEDKDAPLKSTGFDTSLKITNKYCKRNEDEQKVVS